jgi:hypothetical protein
MSAITGKSYVSHISSVPELGRMRVMMMGNEIFKQRSSVADILKQMKFSLRTTLTSSQINMILKKIGFYYEIVQIKSFLREMGFNWNGMSCSFFELFQACKARIQGDNQKEEDFYRAGDNVQN